MDVTEKHTHPYPKDWRVIRCPVSFYKNKTGYEGVVAKHSLQHTDILYLGMSNCVKNISNLLVYCDFNRQKLPTVIALKNLPEAYEKDVLEALFIRGYRSVDSLKTLPIPECKYLYVFRNQTDAVDKLT